MSTRRAAATATTAATVLLGMVLALLPALPARAAAVTLTTSATSVVAGQAITLSGSAGTAHRVKVLIQQRSSGRWNTVAATRSDPSGDYAVDWQPATSGKLHAYVPSSGTTSDPVRVSVHAFVSVPRRIPAQYLTGARVSWAVTPTTYSGPVTVTDRSGAVLGSATAAGGRVRMHLAAPDIGRIPVTVTTQAADGLADHTQSARLAASVRRLEVGSRGAIVRALLVRLRSLHYHIPHLTKRYSHPVSDVVLALQKVNGLKRTARMGGKTWRALADARPVRARHGGRGVHIEVDKTRQILKLVRGRRVLGTLHVSTGLTGNTPVGKFHIYTKGNGGLYRFMGFLGNFGIHGYVPVPPYPASHGCVREPMWAADWTYRHSPIGTPVFIYP